jgi:Hsp20/alpha crystallin family protein
LAGFSPDEITVTAEQSVLTVEGRKGEKGQRNFVYRGIASRPFKRQFSLAAHVRVEGARFDNGLLQVELVRAIPDAMKARRIPIDDLAASDAQQIERKSGLTAWLSDGLSARPSRLPAAASVPACPRAGSSVKRERAGRSRPVETSPTP